MTTPVFWTTKTFRKDLFSSLRLSLTSSWLWLCRDFEVLTLRLVLLNFFGRADNTAVLLRVDGEGGGTQKAPAVWWRQQALWSGFNVVPCSVSHAAPCVTSIGITSALPWSVETCFSLSSGQHRHSPLGQWPEVLLIVSCLIIKCPLSLSTTFFKTQISANLRWTVLGSFHFQSTWLTDAIFLTKVSLCSTSSYLHTYIL